MPKPAVNGKDTNSHGKHKKWDKDEINADVGDDIDPKFMKGDLNVDLKSFIKSLDLPSTVPERGSSSKQDTKPKKAKAPAAKPTEHSKPPKTTTPTQKPATSKEKQSTQLSQPAGKHKRFGDVGASGQPNGVSPPSHNSKGKGKAKLIVEPAALWSEHIPPLSPLDEIPQLSEDEVARMTAKADRLLKQEAETAETDPKAVHAMGSSDQNFLSQILHAGTSSDRLSALTLLAQASPVHNQRALEGLKSMAGKKARSESLKAFRAIVDLWTGGAAPERKLRYIVDQPLGHPDVTDKHLVYWAFEDWFKKYFFSLLQILEQLTLDTLPYVRTQAVAFVFTLLRDRPEQEQNLLRLLVNKLGDADKGVASKSSFFILQLLQVHPSMKAVVIREVSSLILRPTPKAGGNTTAASVILATQHARYYGVLTFSQITLTSKEPEVAQLLVALYFELFVTLLGSPSAEAEKLESNGQGGETDDRAKSNAKSKSKSKLKKKKGDKKDDGTFSESDDTVSKLIAAILTGVNRALPFTRTDDAIFDEHIDTLFRITHTATFNVSIQALLLIQQIAVSRPAIQDRFYRTLYESLLDSRLSTSSKQAMYLNLLFKAWKMDDDHARLCAFVKRFVQVLGMHQPSFICGGMFLLGEIFSQKPRLREMFDEVEVDSESGEEDAADKGQASGSSAVYDPKKRDPRGAGADSTPLWEIAPLLAHFHPSVALHARELIDGQSVSATADLNLNTTSTFLDRFITKAPKKVAVKGASIMQPGSAAGDGAVLVRQLRGVGVQSLDEATLKAKPASQVSVDQLFFHQYLQQKRDVKAKSRSSASSKKGVDESRDFASDAETDSEEEAEIWKAMKRSMPKTDGIPESDGEVSDDLPSDLGSGPEDDEDEDDGPGMEMLGLEDEDDLILSDEQELPSDGDSDGEWGGLSGGQGTKKKRKLGNEEDESDPAEKTKKKRKKAEPLPTFASYDDYAKMIDEAPEEDL